jgi:hypothetical protein
MNKTNFEIALVSQLAEVNKVQQPDRDLWPGIELASLCESSESLMVVSGKKIYAIAATVAIFGLIGWLSVNQYPASLTGDELVTSLSAQHVDKKMLY